MYVLYHECDQSLPIVLGQDRYHRVRPFRRLLKGKLDRAIVQIVEKTPAMSSMLQCEN